MKALTRLLVCLMAGALLAACDGSSKMSADDHVARGQTLLEKGKVRDAIKDFIFATRKQPDSVKAHWSLAQAYLAAEDGAAAEPEIKRARELGLHRQSAVKALAEALLLQSKFAPPWRRSRPRDSTRPPRPKPRAFSAALSASARATSTARAKSSRTRRSRSPTRRSPSSASPALRWRRATSISRAGASPRPKDSPPSRGACSN
jgi:Flp pilus assembly protein TadD